MYGPRVRPLCPRHRPEWACPLHTAQSRPSQVSQSRAGVQGPGLRPASSCRGKAQATMRGRSLGRWVPTLPPHRLESSKAETLQGCPTCWPCLASFPHRTPPFTLERPLCTRTCATEWGTMGSRQTAHLWKAASWHLAGVSPGVGAAQNPGREGRPQEGMACARGLRQEAAGDTGPEDKSPGCSPGQTHC